MAGLLSQGMGQPSQPAPQQPPQQGQQPPQQGQRDGRVDVDPEQAQAMYDALMQGMLGFLYEEGLPMVREALQTIEDPVEAMARVINNIMTTTFYALSQQGKTVPPGILFQGGMELSRAVGELAVKLQRLPPQGNGEAIEGAFMMALAMFGKTVGQNALTDQQRQRFGEMIRTMRDLKQKSGGQPQQQMRQPAAQSQAAPAQKPMREGGMR